MVSKYDLEKGPNGRTPIPAFNDKIYKFNLRKKSKLLTISMICEITEDKLKFKDANLNFRYTACFITKNNVVHKKQIDFCIHIYNL